MVVAPAFDGRLSDGSPQQGRRASVGSDEMQRDGAMIVGIELGPVERDVDSVRFTLKGSASSSGLPYSIVASPDPSERLREGASFRRETENA